MGFTVSSLTDYVDQSKTELLTALHFEGGTADLATIHPGIKSSEALNYVVSTPVPQDGTGCGFNASGDTTFSQRNLATAAVKYQDNLCPRTLESKWTQLLLKKGQKYDEAAIPKIIIDDIANVIIENTETADWLGDTTSGSAYLNRYDGLRKIIKAATGTVVVTPSTYNLTNARTIMAAIVAAIPAKMKGDPKVKILLGFDAADTYRQALINANLYHLPSGSKDQRGLYGEGSVHEIIPLHGLDGLTGSAGDNPFIFAMNPDRNLHLGVDMENEEEEADVWYSKDDDVVKYSFRFRRGWQIGFPSEIVEYSNT